MLLNALYSPKKFGLRWPVPSVPKDSPCFNELKYWQGPTWININWLIIDGLERYGFTAEAQMLRERTLELLRNSGMNEYFSPLSGSPAGTENFSWTAALAVDLLKTS